MIKMIHDKRYYTISEMIKFILLRLEQYIMLHDFHIEQLIFISFLTNVYFYTLALKCCCASVAYQAAFRQHPFLVADLPQQPDIGDLYRYIFA